MKNSISIVTVVYNDYLGLTKTLESISNQSCNDYELLIIDGGSSDKTLSVIKKYEAIISYQVSEKDNGIYDAMNKGLDQCNGKWVIFLNAGDEFNSPDTLFLALQEMKDSSTTYFGRAKIISGNKDSWLYPSGDISIAHIKNWLIDKLPNHQAIFFPKSFYRHNRYNLNFNISSDSDFKLRALKDQYSFLDMTICKFYLGGLSSSYTLKNAFQQFRERLSRTTGQGGWFYAIKGLIKSFIKIMISKLFGHKAFRIIENLKYFEKRK
jgi:putative colanic acid biosynthesis glycosyltransferase